VEPAATARDWLRAGLVGSPHGLDGSFHVLQGRPHLLQQGGRVLLGGDLRLVQRRAGHDARLILRVDGCADRDAAMLLRGQELLVPREAAPELEAEEWWAEDLEGCTVLDGERFVGVVRRLLGLPSCEVLEVEREGAVDLLVPLVSDAVRGVDVEGRRIDVDLEFLGEA
jgi:16S rRNA processing protein RimM